MNLYPNRFTAVLDACVLGGVLKRNMLLSLAEAGLFRPRWSNRILDETERAISKITKGNADTLLQRREIEKAFPDGLVNGFEIFEVTLQLPDPNDNHVLAAAIETCAAVIVTDNIKHFPAAELEPHSIEACPADDFIADVIDLHPSEATLALKRMRERFNRPALDEEALIKYARKMNLPQVAAAMNEHRASLRGTDLVG